MKNNIFIILVIGVIVIIFLGISNFNVPLPGYVVETRPMPGATCDSTIDCENTYTMVYSSCSCSWILFNTEQLETQGHIDCTVMCKPPLKPKPTSMLCMDNICNLMWA
jgi:hypothetical protein